MSGPLLYTTYFYCAISVERQRYRVVNTTTGAIKEE